MPPRTAPADAFSTLGGADLGLVHAGLEPKMRTPTPLARIALRRTLVEDVDLEQPFLWTCGAGGRHRGPWCISTGGGS